jgi:hypothetical protein
MSSPPDSDPSTRPESLKKLAQLQIDRLKEVYDILYATFDEVIQRKHWRREEPRMQNSKS